MVGANYTLQRLACCANPIFGLTIYLFGGSGYPTLGYSRLRDPMRSLFSLLSMFLPLKLSYLLFSFLRIASTNYPFISPIYSLC